MRIGVYIIPDHPWQQARDEWRRAEEMGFDHAWTFDHLVWGSLPDNRWFSCIPTLTAAALVTQRIPLGAFVISRTSGIRCRWHGSCRHCSTSRETGC